MKKKLTCLCLPEDLQKNFQEVFPRMQTVFLARAMKLALEDREFFNKVWFSDTSYLTTRPNQK